jgi:AraC-like DNA-binding protein
MLVYVLMVYTLVISSVLLFAKKDKHISVILLGCYSSIQIICVGSYFLKVYQVYIYNKAPQLFFINTPFLFLIIPLFFLYIKTSIHSEYRYNRIWIYHFIFFVIVLIYSVMKYWFKPDTYIHELFQSRTELLNTESIVVTILFDFQYIFYCVLLMVELKQVIRNRQLLFHTVFNHYLLKATIYLYVFGCLLTWMTDALYFFRLQPGFDIRFLNSIFFYFFFLFLFYITVKGYNKGKVFKYSNTELNHEELQQLYDKIISDIKANKPYMEPTLSLNQYSKSINENSRSLSQAINHVFGSNFSDFMNYHRIELAKQMLCTMPYLTIQEVMYNTGFNS